MPILLIFRCAQEKTSLDEGACVNFHVDHQAVVVEAALVGPFRVAMQHLIGVLSDGTLARNCIVGEPYDSSVKYAIINLPSSAVSDH